MVKSKMIMSKPKPVFLLAGGRGSDRTLLTDLIQTVFKESGVTSPSIAYIGTASRDDHPFFQRIADLFEKAGAHHVTHAKLTSSTADLKKAQDILNSADILFVGGGDVEEGMRVLQEKKMVTLLRRLYETGKPFFGLSAGSIMLSKQWVRWSDPADDSTATLFPCLGFAPLICDTHGEQDNWEELQVALKLAKNDKKGYGIVSGAAIKVYPTGKVEALGHPTHLYIRFESEILRGEDIQPTNSQSRT